MIDGSVYASSSDPAGQLVSSQVQNGIQTQVSMPVIGCDVHPSADGCDSPWFCIAVVHKPFRNGICALFFDLWSSIECLGNFGVANESKITGGTARLINGPFLIIGQFFDWRRRSMMGPIRSMSLMLKFWENIVDLAHLSDKKRRHLKPA